MALATAHKALADHQMSLYGPLLETAVGNLTKYQQALAEDQPTK